MSPVHDRMPVILRPSEADAYLNDDAAARKIIARVPPELMYRTA
jgi:putative SOS response-associated peptidase YedK